MDRPIVLYSRGIVVLLAMATATTPSTSRAQAQPGGGGAGAAATTATTATTSPGAIPPAPPAPPLVAEYEPPPQPPRCTFEDLLRVEIRDRRLAIAMTPPKSLEADVAAGHSAAITVVDSDAIDWRISGARGGNGGGNGGNVANGDNGDASGKGDRVPKDGDARAAAARQREPAAADAAAPVYTRFAIAPPPDSMPDRWSPLQLTSVAADDGELCVIGSGRVGRTFVTVEYRQDRAVNAARLTVLRSRRAGVGRPLHDFTAPDLLKLWNDHQRECRQYLVPLLKTIAPRQNLLRPRAGDVYRVFRDIPADAQVTKQLAALLPELEADSPGARDAASAKIESLGAAGVLAMLRMDRSEWTPEQTARLAAIVQRQSTLNDSPAWQRDIYFLTDCLDDADPAVRQAALASVRAIAGRAVEFDVDAAPSARLAAAQEILRSLETSTGAR
jgi:hypothetical protein